MQPVLELNINKASFKHNLHVFVPGLDFFFFQFKLICGLKRANNKMDYLL